MDYAPFKKPSRLAGLFSYRSVIPPSPHKTLRCKLSWGPRSTGQEGSGHQFHHANLQQSKGKALLRYFCATMHPVARVHPSVCSALSSSKQRGTAKGIPLLFPSFAAHRILDPAQKPLTAQLAGALCSDQTTTSNWTRGDCFLYSQALLESKVSVLTRLFTIIANAYTIFSIRDFCAF